VKKKLDLNYPTSFLFVSKRIEGKHAVTIIGYTNDYNFYLTDKKRLLIINFMKLIAVH